MSARGRYGAITVTPEMLQALTETAGAVVSAGSALSSSRRARKDAQAAATLEAQQQAALLHQQERIALAQQQAAIARSRQTPLMLAIGGSLLLVTLAVVLSRRRKE